MARIEFKHLDTRDLCVYHRIIQHVYFHSRLSIQILMKTFFSDLFKRAISLSGSALAKIALNERTVSDSRDLVNAAGCNDESFNKMLKCMKGKSVDALMDAVDTIVGQLLTLVYKITTLKTE